MSDLYERWDDDGELDQLPSTVADGVTQIRMEIDETREPPPDEPEPDDDRFVWEPDDIEIEQ